MQKPKRFTWAALGAALLTAGMLMPSAHAQSADALLDKLVDKGVLTVKEAQELREQSDDGFHKAFQANTGMPDWVNQMKISGDVRGRYDVIQTENDFPGAGEPNKDRARLRYRLRVGATATLLDRFEAGFRLTSSEPNADGTGGDPISGNTTFQNNGSKKFVYIDLAYGKWTPISHGPWLLSTTIGKMENPFTVSDMVFDGDYTPEGIALQVGYTFNDKHSLKLTGGLFALDEINQGAQASDDPYLVGAQLRFDSKWTPKFSTTVGLAWMKDVLQLIRDNSTEQDYLVAYPYHPSFNVLANRRTYERSVYVDNAVAKPGWPAAAIARIEKHQPRIVIIGDWDVNGTEASRFKNWAAPVLAHIRQHYELRGTFDEKEKFEIYVRRSTQ